MWYLFNWKAHLNLRDPAATKGITLAASINARIVQSCPSKNEFRLANGWYSILSTSKYGLHSKSSSHSDFIPVSFSVNADSGQHTCHRPAWHSDSIWTISSFISGSNPETDFLRDYEWYPKLTDPFIMTTSNSEQNKSNKISCTKNCVNDMSHSCDYIANKAHPFSAY